ncbi:MAG: hypothetical protein JO199_05140, partial [Candidatus Eremiobacteraeota bacterium]|nr:hypothetical protein [Candidatus Eremiobacteraeota bacterium]
ARLSDRPSADRDPTFLFRMAEAHAIVARPMLEALAKAPPQIVFLGDSTVWGYGLPPGANVVSILDRGGCPCVNLAFEAGSSPNDYALARLFERYGVRPKLVVLQISQPSFNPEDQSYRTLPPGLAALAEPLLTPQDRNALDVPPPNQSLASRAERRLSAAWLVYGARADLRAQLSGDVDPLPAKSPVADDFLGTYNLAPLDETNVGVQYLKKTVDLFHARGIPIVAFLTPTNHVLLHEFIDVPAYAANARYLAGILEKRGVRVIDLDRAIPAGEFFDNTHLTAQGQRRLAALLARNIPELGLDRIPSRTPPRVGSHASG